MGPAVDDRMRTQVSALAPELRAHWGLDAAVAALDGGPEPPAVIPGSPSLDSLALGDPVAPITDLEELADACGRALEQPDDWLGIELAIDGVARLGLELQEMGTRWTALVRQARRVERGSGRMSSRTLARLLSRIAGDDLYSPMEGVTSLAGVVTGRWQEVAVRLRAGVAQALLSPPSHSHGWISASALADRVESWEGAEASPTDQVGALLRLHGARLDEPRARLAELASASPLAARFAYALGAAVAWPDDDDHVRAVADSTRGRLTDATWVDRQTTLIMEALERRQTDRAYRRVPWRELDNPRVADGARPLAPLRQPDPWPQEKVEREPYSPERDRRRREEAFDHPLAHRFGSVVELVLGWDSWSGAEQRWNLSGAPGYLVMAALTRMRPEQVPSPGLLERLLDPTQPLPPALPYVVAYGYGADDPAAKALVEDVVVQLIDDGRFDPARDGAVAARTLSMGQAKTNRVVSTLAAVAGAGDLHTDEVARMLDHLVAGLDDAPTNAFELLELSDELHGRCGRAVVDPDARASLERWSKGSSRRAQMARQLLGRQASPSPVRAAAARTRVQLRLDRAPGR